MACSPPPTGFSYVFSWDALADVGPTASITYVRLKIVARDSAGSGQGASIVLFALSNSGSTTPTSPTGPNMVPDMMSVGTPSGLQRGIVTIPYTVADAQSDPVNVSAFYRVDAISGWQPATMTQSSDPITGVATTPTGRTYFFVWDALTDLGRTSKPAVIFRVQASDAGGQSASRVTGSFAVDNG